MAMTNSTMLNLGTPAPDFSLPNTDGSTVSLSDFSGKPLLVAFISNHCPFVQHLADAFKAFADEYQPQGLAVVAIGSNNVQSHPADAPEKMIEEAATRGYNFPYLYDATQDIAKAYHAACTPDFFLFDADHKLYYRGQFDETRPSADNPQTPTGADMRAAADAALASQPAPQNQVPSIGCNIKWIPGQEPSYYQA